ncbi:hypothetical protein L6654_38865 [Bradyrhizobium sp. WYCCWR 13023]|uniref:Uncharacterized protein n=1 Tax=Bradyrhizobium zhengyangense TaxID=2911009 RepID=A0A9X1RH41_9BRAD|nr:hypothetical protein [Bradyrhizobium zhengyangense]MCG2632571.1 hypothetical protein [Bradyrhizobium zhengyangense]
MRTRSKGPGRQREPGWREAIDLAQVSDVEAANPTAMKKPADQVQRSNSNSRKARLEEARRAAEEYAADVREIIRKLRARLLD